MSERRIGAPTAGFGGGTSATRARVYIADDHGLVRHGLARLIAESPDLALAGEASDGRQVLVAAETDEWDVLVLDLSLPRVSGVEVFRRLREARPQLPILILSMHPAEQYALRLLREGAAGYVSKDQTAEHVLDVLRRVVRGERYLPPGLSREDLFADEGPPRYPHEALTAREYQVFILLVQGRAVSDIAAELDVTVSTVSSHLGRVRDKLGAATVADIVHYAHRVGLAG